VWDATGQNPILVADLEGFMANGSTGDRILIASTAFLQATSPAAVPDFIMAELIPESYLAAGSLTFEEDDGTIYWRLSWGGTGYSGSNLGHSDNDDSLPGVMADFGPPFAGAMPSTTLQALLFPGAATDVSTSNSLDYAVSASPAVFRNNARSAFTVIAAATVMGDVDGDRDVDLVDFGRCVDCLAGPDGVIPDSCTDEDFVSCDLSDDSDVDVLDVAEFYLVMTDP